MIDCGGKPCSLAPVLLAIYDDPAAPKTRCRRGTLRAADAVDSREAQVAFTRWAASFR